MSMGVGGVGYTSYRGLGYSTGRSLEDSGSGASPSNAKDSAATTDGSSQSTNAQGKDSGEVKDKVTISGSKDGQNQTETDREVQRLKQRDQEVKAHELAHQSVGGRYAGAPHYEYQTGPDGKKYAVGGEVSIDTSDEKDPEATVNKMRQVRASALAPANPSTQDMKVASEASQKEATAQQEAAKEKSGSSGKTETGKDKSKDTSGTDTGNKDNAQTQENVKLPGGNTEAKNSKKTAESTQPNRTSNTNYFSNKVAAAYTQHTAALQINSKISVYA